MQKIIEEGGVLIVDAELRKRITNFIVEKITPEFIVLFGSQATGLTHLESDVDIAFYKPHHELSAFEILGLATELAGLIKIKVDLIDLNTASTVFKAQIFSTGEPLYMTSQFDFDEYQMRTLSMYFNFDFERREILQSIIESGSVYDNQK